MAIRAASHFAALKLEQIFDFGSLHLGAHLEITVHHDGRHVTAHGIDFRRTLDRIGRLSGLPTWARNSNAVRIKSATIVCWPLSMTFVAGCYNIYTQNIRIITQKQ